MNFGMEVSTDIGHMIAIGLKQYVGGIRRAPKLREELDKVGGFLIVAHPFRHLFDPVTAMRKGGEPFTMTPEQAAEMPVFKLVHAIEVGNGANTPRENYFASRWRSPAACPTPAAATPTRGRAWATSRRASRRYRSTPDSSSSSCTRGRFEACTTDALERPLGHASRRAASRPASRSCPQV